MLSYHDLELEITLFKDAEEAWFWFVKAYEARSQGARITAGAGLCNRPCEPVIF